MFLHELSRKISQNWSVRVDGEEYGRIVREWFKNQCPYCSCELTNTESVIEHLDGMNQYRAGLHVPGNVLVACRRCNNQKRRDDSLKTLLLATSGWESFLSHDGTRCAAPCRTCTYWESIWNDQKERQLRLIENAQRIRAFRSAFPEFQKAIPFIKDTQPTLLKRLYSDCQTFAAAEIKSLLEKVDTFSNPKS